MICFISTTFLAAIWAEAGFKVWQTLDWYWAFGIWFIYLGPVLLGYYLGGVLGRLQTELNSLVEKGLSSQPTVQQRREKEKEIFNGLLKNNDEYKRIWWKFLVFGILMVFDICLGIWLYKSEVIV